ncbi:MAG: hypothetical protein ACM3SR_12845 [Ignavibacteriales bacterium]
MKGKAKRLIKQKEFKVSYRPLNPLGPGVERLIEFLGRHLAKRGEAEFKKLKIESEEGEK